MPGCKMPRGLLEIGLRRYWLPRQRMIADSVRVVKMVRNHVTVWFSSRSAIPVLQSSILNLQNACPYAATVVSRARRSRTDHVGSRGARGVEVGPAQKPFLPSRKKPTCVLSPPRYVSGMLRAEHIWTECFLKCSARLSGSATKC